MPHIEKNPAMNGHFNQKEKNSEGGEQWNVKEMSNERGNSLDSQTMMILNLHYPLVLEVNFFKLMDINLYSFYIQWT